MKQDSKLTLSVEELQLVNDREWILTKHVITRKVYHLFGILAERFKEETEKRKDQLPLPAVQSIAKISKGENYRQLPYVMLDYPRCFDAENTFAIRTMFWWGNFFSVTLQLSGDQKKMFEKNLCKNLDLLQKENFYICVNDDQWQHHFEQENYTVTDQLTREEFESAVLQKQFLKLAVKFPLQRWNEMEFLLEKSFMVIMRALQN